jgi:tetratricopeptide (TPR) repeat protein
MRLAIRQGNALDRDLELPKCDLQIGRSALNDIVLPDPSQSVSRVHAKLQYEDGRYILTDLDSANGTWVGECRVSTVPLQPGEPVTLGPYTLMLQSETSQWDESLARRLDECATATATATRTSHRATLPKAKDKEGYRKISARGSLAYLANLPRPILFGGFAVCIIGVIVLGQILAPGRQGQRTVVAGAVPRRATAARNAELVQQHITEAKRLLARHEFDRVVEQLGQALFMEPANAEALELKMRASAMKAVALAAESSAPTPFDAKKTAASLDDAKPAQSPSKGHPSPERMSTPAVRRTRTDSRMDLSPDRMKELYDRAKSALEGGAFQDAIAILGEIERDEPQYRDVPALLVRARDEQHSMARQVLEAAEKLEATGELPDALKRYESAQRLDASTASVVEDSTRRLTARMKNEAADAVARAKVYDAYGRIQEATAMYERAYKYMSDADPSKKAVKDRLEVLGARQ